MPDSYKELIKSNPDETEIRSFLVDGDQVSVTLRIPDTLRDAAKASKDFSAVDAMKQQLLDAGVEVRMSAAGVELIPGPGFSVEKLDAL